MAAVSEPTAVLENLIAFIAVAGPTSGFELRPSSRPTQKVGERGGLQVKRTLAQGRFVVNRISEPLRNSSPSTLKGKPRRVLR